MPFKLANALSTFQSYIDRALQPYLDEFVIVYLDDILVYSSTDAEHARHVMLVLEAFWTHGLFAKLEKCSFEKEEVEYLDFIISFSDLSMDPIWIKTITEWLVPTSIKEIQVFLGFCNFYRRFIKGYSQVALPMMDLTKFSQPF